MPEAFVIRDPLITYIVAVLGTGLLLGIGHAEVIWRKRSGETPFGWIGIVGVAFLIVFAHGVYKDGLRANLTSPAFWIAFILPITFMYFVGLYLFKNSSYLKALLEDVEDLKTHALKSKNFTDPTWRAQSVAEDPSYYGNPDELLRRYLRGKNKSFVFPSLMAWNFLGKPFSEVQAHLRAEVEENKLRYEHISGRKLLE